MIGLVYAGARSLLAVARASPHLRKVGRTSKLFYEYYNTSKMAQMASSFPFGFMYAGGTVVGYQHFDSIYGKKWKYLGSPQRIKKI